MALCTCRIIGDAYKKVLPSVESIESVNGISKLLEFMPTT
jgi:hypothetical protein